MNGKVSIIMPAYNSAGFISRAIDSVLAQTYTDWELLVIDDCSADGTAEVVKTYSDGRIRLLQNQKNSGAAVARNYGMREATGKWVAFLDSDDRWVPEKLERQLRFMTDHGYSFCYTDYRIINTKGTPLPYIFTAPNKVTKRSLHLYCWFSTITVMYDREKIGLIQTEDIKINEDYAVWFALSERADAYRLPECLSVCHKRNGSLSSGSKLKLIRHHYIMFRKARGKNPASAVFWTGVNLVFGVIRKVFFKKRCRQTEPTLEN